MIVTARRLAAALSLLVGLVAVLPTLAAAQEVRAFTVLRDGAEIGEHRFAFRRSGDELQVTVDTNLAVKVAFVTVFRFEHHRLERWSGDKLLSLEGRTNDDGTDYRLEIVAEGNGYTRTVNGKREHIDGPATVASVWTPVILTTGRLISAVADQVYQVSTEALGRETVNTGAGSLEGRHYRMTGDLERELWYDDAGNLLKVRFERRGSTVEYLLKGQP